LIANRYRRDRGKLRRGTEHLSGQSTQVGAENDVLSGLVPGDDDGRYVLRPVYSEVGSQKIAVDINTSGTHMLTVVPSYYGRQTNKRTRSNL